MTTLYVCYFTSTKLSFSRTCGSCLISTRFLQWVETRPWSAMKPTCRWGRGLGPSASKYQEVDVYWQQQCSVLVLHRGFRQEKSLWLEIPPHPPCHVDFMSTWNEWARSQTSGGATFNNVQLHMQSVAININVWNRKQTDFEENR